MSDRAVKRGLLILGQEPPRARALRAAEECDEVFVLARIVPDPGSRFVIDEELAARQARDRLARLARRLRARGVRVRGAISDADAAAARQDGEALYPGASVLA
jgi:hypothetical protein